MGSSCRTIRLPLRLTATRTDHGPVPRVSFESRFRAMEAGTRALAELWIGLGAARHRSPVAQSWRSASAGSMRVISRAGKNAAIVATAANSAGTARNVAGSVAGMP